MLKRSRWMVGLICFFGAWAWVGCGTPTKTDPKEGTLQLTVALEASPAKVGANTLHVHVKDAQGQMLEGCKLTISPNMPAHGHGSSKEVTLKEEEKGHFQAEVYFQMKGAWEVKVRAEKGSDFAEKTLPVDVQ